MSTAEAPRRVLLAEDEAIIRLDLREMLEEEGYEVVAEAGDGHSAVRLTDELRPDVVVMDIKMPGLDGSRRLRGSRAGGSRRSLSSPRSASGSWLSGRAKPEPWVTS